jgi:hypothetical protein
VETKSKQRLNEEETKWKRRANKEQTTSKRRANEKEKKSKRRASEESRAKQRKAKQSKAEQSRAKQSKATKIKSTQSKANQRNRESTQRKQFYNKSDVRRILLDALSVPLPAHVTERARPAIGVGIQGASHIRNSFSCEWVRLGANNIQHAPLKITQRFSLPIFIVCTFHSLIIPLYANIYVFICISEAWALLFDAQYLA